jgi:hypothetical protein
MAKDLILVSGVYKMVNGQELALEADLIRHIIRISPRIL